MLCDNIKTSIYANFAQVFLACNIGIEATLFDGWILVSTPLIVIY